MSKQSFIKGTLILLAAGILNRLLGFIPRITLPRIIGAEGVGLYHMGWPFLIVLLTLITGGIPIAVAKLVAEAEATHHQNRISLILKICMGFTLLISILCIFICWIASTWISTHLLKDPRTSIIITTMSPMIIFIGVSSVLRGYFQGKLNMVPTAISQITETMVRICMVLIGAYVMLPFGIEYAAAGAMMGVTIGEIAGMLVLIKLYVKSKPQELHTPQQSTQSVGHPYQRFRKELLRIVCIAVPVTGSKLIGASSYLFESIMIFQSLAIAGISVHVATAQYGSLQGMVIPILLLPSALTYSLSVSLVPSLSDAFARKDYKTIQYQLQQSLRISLISGAPFAMIMFMLAEPICTVMFNAPHISPMLKMMAPIAIFIYLQAPLQAALQALDHSKIALIHTLIGSCIKLVLIYWLASDPRLGILGAIIAMCTSIVIVTFLNGFSLLRMIQLQFRLMQFVRLGVVILISGMSTYFVINLDWGHHTLLPLILACFVGFITYISLIYVFGIINSADVQKFKKIFHHIFH